MSRADAQISGTDSRQHAFSFAATERHRGCTASRRSSALMRRDASVRRQPLMRSSSGREAIRPGRSSAASTARPHDRVRALARADPQFDDLLQAARAGGFEAGIRIGRACAVNTERALLGPRIRELEAVLAGRAGPDALRETIERLRRQKDWR